MPIEFRCTRCGRLLRTPDDTAGKQAKCPECGAEQTIPEPGEAGSPPPPPGAQTSPFQGPPPQTAQDTASPYQSPQYAGSAPPQQDGKAVASLVFGILTLVLGCCCPLAALLTGVAGITLGVMSWHAANRSLAVAGVICTSIGLVLALINGIIGAYLAATGQHPLFQ
jgi:phage FluMu protein Com